MYESKFFRNSFCCYLNYFLYLCTWIVQLDRNCRFKTSSFVITESAAYAALSVVKSIMTYLYESGLWVGRQSRHNGRRLSTLCLRHTEIFQNYQYQSLEYGPTVDVPGVIISIPWRPCKHELCPFGCS